MPDLLSVWSVMMYWELERRQGDLRSFSSPGSRTLSKAWTKSYLILLIVFTECGHGPKSSQMTVRTHQVFAPPPTKNRRRRAVEWGSIFSGIAEIFADSAKNKHFDSVIIQSNHPKIVMPKYSLRFSLEILQCIDNKHIKVLPTGARNRQL